MGTTVSEEGDVDYLFLTSIYHSNKEEYTWEEFEALVGSENMTEMGAKVPFQITTEDYYVVMAEALHGMIVLKGVAVEPTEPEPAPAPAPVEPEPEPAPVPAPVDPEPAPAPAPVDPEPVPAPADPAAVTTVEVSTGTGQRLNVRTGPGTNYKIAAPSLKNGTILQIVETQGQWGKLADDAGWVYLPGTKPVAAPAPAPVEPEPAPAPAEPTTVEVSTGSNLNLNVRTGPGTNYKIAAPSLKNGTVLQIVETQGQWGKLADDAGWVYLPGTKPVQG